MNVIPSLGIRVKLANGKVMTEPTASEPSSVAKVYLIQSTRLQVRKGTVLEAKVDIPVAKEPWIVCCSNQKIPSVHGYGASSP